MQEKINPRMLILTVIVFILCIIAAISCQQPVSYVQPVAPVTSAPVVTQQPYTVYSDTYGQPASVYYTDPYTHAAYWLDYAIFMNMWNSPNRYTVIHHYYDVNRYSISNRNSYYSRTYRNVYRPSSPSTRSYSPTYRQPSPSTYRPSSPSPSSSYRPSSPSRSSSPSYRPSRPSSRRH